MNEIMFRKIVKETAGGICLEIGYNHTEWFPKSQIQLLEDEGIVMVPDWLIREKELEDYLE